MVYSQIPSRTQSLQEPTHMQVAIFLFAMWAGGNAGGVITGLAVAGFVMAATSSAGTIMQALDSTSL